VKTPRRVRVVEVGPRDGLQNEKGVIPTAAKIAFVDALAAAGLPEIEASSFVSPQWVPQLADASLVFAGIHRCAGVSYTALVPNLKGFERALEAKVTKIAIFTAASDTFNKKNTNATIAESIQRFMPVVAEAGKHRLPVRAYVSTAFHCPYEGKIDANAVLAVVRLLINLGCDELSIGDTIGRATPADLDPVLDLLQPLIPPDRLALHFHDTRGTALANVYHSLLRGVEVFDASAGGLGGCPYAPGASGNLATEDLVYLLRGLGIETGVDLDKVVEAALGIEQILGRTLPGRVLGASRPRPSSMETRS
jgi:hydroxymethylglutaryl-CoA lyase